jgi:hypothetical protein
MKRNFPNKNHWRTFYLLRFGVLVFFAAMPAQGVPLQRPRPAMPASGPQQIQKPAVLSMRVDEGWITATIVDSPLQNVLGELAARTGVIFEVRSQVNPLVSVRLHRVSLQEAIQRISSGNNTIYFYDKNQPESGRITLVQLFPRTDTSPQPDILYLGTGAITKGNDIADTPEQAMKILAESPSVEARERAVEILADARGDRAIKALIKAVFDPAPQIRASVIESLAALNVRAALPNILKSLKDSNPAVRQSAATAVALLGSAQNLKDLKPLSADKDAGVVAAAEMAIRKLSAAAKK